MDRAESGIIRSLVRSGEARVRSGVRCAVWRHKNDSLIVPVFGLPTPSTRKQIAILSANYETVSSQNPDRESRQNLWREASRGPQTVPKRRNARVDFAIDRSSVGSRRCLPRDRTGGVVRGDGVIRFGKIHLGALPQPPTPSHQRTYLPR